MEAKSKNVINAIMHNNVVYATIYTLCLPRTQKSVDVLVMCILILVYR